MLSNAVISWIRTIVPVVVGVVVAWVQPFGIEVDTTEAVTVLTAVATAVYYTLARMIESKFPKWGFLLGVPREPIYAKGPVQKDPIDPLNP